VNLSDEFSAHLKSKGMVRSLTVHDTPEENGVSERLNCTLLEHTRAMHLAVGLPKFLWTESVQHAVWLKNRHPHVHWTERHHMKSCIA